MTVSEKIISHVQHGSAGRFRISYLWGRLTEVGSSHVLFRSHDASIPSSVCNSDVGADGSIGEMHHLSQAESSSYMPSHHDLLSVEFNE